MDHFLPGLELSRRFYFEAVQPVLEKNFPELQYAAGLIGQGSEILGFDTPRSTDHNWGPRLMLFVNEPDRATFHQAIYDILGRELPGTFYGYSTHFGSPDAIGVRLMADAGDGPVQHRVEVLDLREYVLQELGVDATRELSPVDWLVCPQQKLFSLTAGAVYTDPIGELTVLRRRLVYYPHEVWLYCLAAQWQRISQEEAFMGRCGDVGDELGSVVIATRLVRDLMRLGFLMEKRYCPYIKWFGTAFAQLDCAPQMMPIFQQIVQAKTWLERQQHLSSAFEIAAELHNRLGITAPLETHVSQFYTRPYLVIHAERFVQAIYDRIEDEEVLRLTPMIGSVDQWIDNTDVLETPPSIEKIRGVYGSHP